MRNFHARSALIVAVAFVGAVMWGAAEFLALQWSRLLERPRSNS
jgi:hypothetical protein